MENSELTIQLTGNIDRESVSDHTMAFRDAIEDKLLDAEVSFPTKKAGIGEKGDPVTVGLIILSLITSGSVVALLECIKGIMARDKKIEFDIKKKNGECIKVTSQNVSTGEIKELLNQILEG